MSLELSINGETRAFDLDPRTPLLDVLRDACGLTGAKAVCREGFCGACSVLIDGEAKPSCLIPAALAQGCEIVTAEGLAPFGALNAVQAALLEHDVVQCGMCFPGMAVTLTAFLRDRPHPTRDELKTALVGNICRCTGYERIIDAMMGLGHRENGTSR